jgi:hypothetical protein
MPPTLRVLLASGLAVIVATPLVADSTPRGQVLELHSCEVYAGGCVVSAEATTGGNYLLRAWHYDSGSFQGVDLSGLSLALLEKGPQNLADAAYAAREAVAYVPPTSSPAQRAALIDWARANTAAPIAPDHVRAVPLQLAVRGADATLSVGRDITFSAGAPPSCDLSSCGESLWYQPRSATSSFVVDQLIVARVREPLLALQWQDHGRRTLFVGRFGDPIPANPSGLCGAPLVSTP